MEEYEYNMDSVGTTIHQETNIEYRSAGYLYNITEIWGDMSYLLEFQSYVEDIK